ncbi:TetR/AcrR family transcriptional regulator [Bacillus horti]|uniref:AcrR family transcriptional regulator n=1 Tax=Caldalkalibacillus horti TaxID=77523 RepID=A0ABT9W4Q5_9BACI|nr:TetR/AcrR family transcriptional regulator [Bacillus horti]MDQ0168232.1 AcrR family transcriptional regulator [Bacillus horti]
MSKKKEDLLQHSERLFYEYGFHAIGLKRVVNEANVALMTLYNHFASKEELVLAVLKRRGERYFKLLQSSIQNYSSASAAELAEGHLAWIRQHSSKGCMFLRAKEEFASSEEYEIVEYVNQHKQALISYFEELGFQQKQAIQLALLFEGATALAEVLDAEQVSEQLRHLVKGIS